MSRKVIMYQYGYYVAGEKIVLGTVEQSGFEGKKKEIDWANRIDANSRWFIETCNVAGLPVILDDSLDDDEIRMMRR